MKKLYQADGYAVKELLKVTSVLYNAVKTSVSGVGDQPGDSGDVSLAFNIASKVCVLKNNRQLSTVSLIMISQLCRVCQGHRKAGSWGQLIP